MCQKDERGNVIVLGLGIWFFATILILGTIFIVSIYEEKRELLYQADSIALALVNSIDEEKYYMYGEVALPSEEELGKRAEELVSSGTHVSVTKDDFRDVIAVNLTKKSEVIPLYTVLNIDDIEIDVTSYATLEKE